MRHARLLLLTLAALSAACGGEPEADPKDTGSLYGSDGEADADSDADADADSDADADADADADPDTGADTGTDPDPDAACTALDVRSCSARADCQVISGWPVREEGGESVCTDYAAPAALGCLPVDIACPAVISEATQDLTGDCYVFGGCLPGGFTGGCSPAADMSECPPAP